MSKIKLVIDTDIGTDIDDAFALAFALLSPRFEVVGITVVGPYGDLRARLAREICRCCGQDPPIGIGRHEPSGSYAWTGEGLPGQLRWIKENLGSVASGRDSDLKDAAPLIRQALSQSSGPVAMACLGPLTNVAEALGTSAAHDVCPAVLAIMGGETDLVHAEYNFALDPEAADLVMQLPIDRFLATWNVSRRLTLDSANLDYIADRSGALGELLLQLTTAWGGRHHPHPVLYDLSPLLWLCSPDLYGTQRMALRVETKGQFTRGMSIPCEAHWARVSQSSGQQKGLPTDAKANTVATPTEVTVNMDVERAKQIVLETYESAGRQARPSTKGKRGMAK